MANRIMGDSAAGINAIPLSVNVAAAYIDGHIGLATQAEMEARFPHARYGHVWIDVTGAHADTADVLDVETGDATAAIANLWVQSWRKLGRKTLAVVYVNRGNEQAVVAACESGGSVLGKDYGLWVATLDGTQVTGPGVVACQWKGSKLTGGDYDESLVYGSSLWLPVAPPPVPKPVVSRVQAQQALSVLAQFVAEAA